MKYLIFLTFFAAGCSSYPKRQINITHNYIYRNAVEMCTNHEGFHYMVHITDIEAKTSSGGIEENYPCSEQTKIRCQDGTLHNFDTGISYCFIGQMQLEETLDAR